MLGAMVMAGVGALAGVVVLLGFAALRGARGPRPAVLLSANLQSSTPAPDERIATEERTVLVLRVVDGDTIDLATGEHVRYVGVNTPEMVDPRRPVQCFGKEASERNRELMEGKRVRLEKDISETDKYGRLLRYVYVGDVFVNLARVEEGFARVSIFPPDVKYQEKFLEAERRAREEKRGLWSGCPAR